MPRKSTLGIQVAKDFEANTVSFTFGSDEPVVIDINGLSDEVKRNGLVHGVVQKLQDSYAGEKDLDGVKGSFMKVYDAIVVNGKWSTRGEGEGEAPSLLREAVRRFLSQKRGSDQTLDQAVEFMKSLNEETAKALAATPTITKLKAQVAEERALAKAKSDVDEVLAGVTI